MWELIGVVFVLALLAGPLLIIWVAAYAALIRYFVPRVGQASKEFSDARSAINGRIVDAYTNIQTVKLFAHAEREEAFAWDAIEHGRKTFAHHALSQCKYVGIVVFTRHFRAKCITYRSCNNTLNFVNSLTWRGIEGEHA